MKNLSAKQLKTLRTLKSWTNLKFHGNRKTLDGLPINFVKSVVEKKRQREALKHSTNTCSMSNVAKVRNLINNAPVYKGTNYHKIMIEGNTGIYYAHPVYGHSDYNKTRLFDITTENLKLMRIFNAIVK